MPSCGGLHLPDAWQCLEDREDLGHGDHLVGLGPGQDVGEPEFSGLQGLLEVGPNARLLPPSPALRAGIVGEGGGVAIPGAYREAVSPPTLPDADRLRGCDRVVGTGDRAADHQQIRAAGEGITRRGGARLVVGVVTREPNAGRDSGEPWRVVVRLFKVAYGAHDARAARLGGEHDPLRHDVRRGIAVAREHGDGERLGWLQAGVVSAFLESLDTGPQHVDPTVSVHGEVLHPERTEHPGGLADRRGDVVQFEIEKDLVPEIGDRTDRLRTGGGVELETNLGHPEVVLERAAEPDRGD